MFRGMTPKNDARIIDLSNALPSIKRKILQMKIFKWLKKFFTFEIPTPPPVEKPEPYGGTLSTSVMKDFRVLSEGTYSTRPRPKIRRFYISISFDITGVCNRFWDPKECEFVMPHTMGLAPGDLIPVTFEIPAPDVKLHQSLAETWATKNLSRTLRRKARFHLHDVKEKE